MDAILRELSQISDGHIRTYLAILRMIADVKKRYQQLSDADLEMVAAAGEVSLPILITGDTDNGKL